MLPEKELIKYLRHASRAYIFSAALRACSAAAYNVLKVILDDLRRETNCQYQSVY
jgi:7-keto-8-aminopelargonate synthetase-like enzyme